MGAYTGAYQLFSEVTLMFGDWIGLVPLNSLWIEGLAYPGVRHCAHQIATARQAVAVYVRGLSSNCA